MPSLNYLKSKVALAPFPDKRSFRNTLFRHLVVKGIPEEWAYLIAERAEQRRYDSNWITSGYAASHIMLKLFYWNEAEEGYGFWKAAYSGILSEEIAANKAAAQARELKSYY